MTTDKDKKIKDCILEYARTGSNSVVKSYRLSDIEKDIYLFLHMPIMEEFVIAEIQTGENEETYLVEDIEIIDMVKNETNDTRKNL